MSDLICKTMKYLGSFINNQKGLLINIKNNKRIYMEIYIIDNMNVFKTYVKIIRNVTFVSCHEFGLLIV